MSTEAPAKKPTNKSVDSNPEAQALPSLEAILLSLDRPAPGAKIAEALAALTGIDKKTDAQAVAEWVEALNAEYERTGRAFRIEQVAGGYRLMTRPELADAVAAFQRVKAPTRLSRAALETLAIIAYRQPITRARLEAIRGVACGEVVRTLIDRDMVRITGRAEELGRPMLYGTTKRFLDQFGLASVKDLPKGGEPER